MTGQPLPLRSGHGSVHTALSAHQSLGLRPSPLWRTSGAQGDAWQAAREADPAQSWGGGLPPAAPPLAHTPRWALAPAVPTALAGAPGTGGGDRARTFVTSRACPDDETLIAPPRAQDPPPRVTVPLPPAVGSLKTFAVWPSCRWTRQRGWTALTAARGGQTQAKPETPPGLDEQLPSQPAHAALGAWTPSLPRRAPRRLAWSWAAGWSSE